MYDAKDFSNLLGLEGFSDDLLNNHFKLYQGYVANTNKAIDLMKTLDKSSPEFAEIKRRFGWEFNGMRLHELYFENMSKESEFNENTKLGGLILESFGSFDEWKEDFVATGKLRGIGWVILAKDKETGKLFNLWINEHDLGHLTGSVPLLVMDVFEHAFILDYGIDRAAYIESFMNAIDWKVVQERIGGCMCGAGGCGSGACGRC